MPLAKPRIGYIKISQFKLNYQIEGEGMPVLIIGSAKYYPRIFSPSLRKHLQLIFIDHRGFGQHAHELKPADYTHEVILEDIETIRRKLKLGRVCLLGHSGHGYLALEYAKKYPKAVSHLVLLAMSPDGSANSFAAAERYFQESVCPERKVLLAQNLSHLSADIAANPKQAFITRILRFGPMIWYNPYFDATHLWQDVTVIPPIMDYLWGSVFRELDITNDLDKLNIPVFLGLGRYDYWNPPHLWENFRVLFTHLTIRVFEKSGHTPPYEEPESFDKELLSWLQAKSSSTSV